jgi:lipoprotein-anchoring transpeptidase ErfK/SrfK
MKLNLRRALLVTALVAAACVAAPAAAQATAPQVSVPAAGIDFAAGTITLAVDYPEGTSRVDLTAAGQLLQSIPIADPTTAGTCSSAPVALTTATTFTAQGFDGTDASVWGPVSVVVSPADLRPTTPQIALRADSLIDPRFTLIATTGNPATHFVVKAKGFDKSERKGACTTTADGRVVLTRLALPYGPETVQLSLANGFGSSAASKPVRLFELGVTNRLPKARRFVLVDKRSMSLYDIYRGRVQRFFPVAVGTPQTPTPNGYFQLGRARPASGPWGVMRRPLYRFSKSHRWATGFYIHGTDEPWSIGTMASHGCVRMFNSDIRIVAKYVPVWALVLIR